MINAGIPTIFLNAAELGYTGTELQDAINGDAAALARFETIRAHGAMRMGLIKDMAEAATRQHTPRWPLSRRRMLYRLQRQTIAAGHRPAACAPCPWASCTTP
jgi:2-methylaconitate cis-trans-isomerase PrpF